MIKVQPDAERPRWMAVLNGPAALLHSRRPRMRHPYAAVSAYLPFTGAVGYCAVSEAEGRAGGDQGTDGKRPR